MEIPPNTCTLADLFAWYEAQAELSKVKAREILLRKKLFKFHFPAPDEGTNSLPLNPLLEAAGIPADGRVLKGGHVINREVDEASLKVLGPTFQEQGIAVADLIKWKPALSVSAYRELTAEQRTLFDQCLIIKDGSPTLEVVLPKAKAAKAVDKT
jgi:hypothetical protein